MPFEREYRDLSFVERWGTTRTLRRQNVAEHSYFVGIYATQTATMIRWKYQSDIHNYRNLVKCAAYHDLFEFTLGDINGPAKRKYLDRRNVEDDENRMLPELFGPTVTFFTANGIKEIVKFADIMDEIMFLSTEKQLGNQSMFVPNQHGVSIFGHVKARLEIAFHAMRPFSLILDDEVWVGLWEDTICNAIERAATGFSRHTWTWGE